MANNTSNSLYKHIKTAPGRLGKSIDMLSSAAKQLPGDALGATDAIRNFSNSSSNGMRLPQLGAANTEQDLSNLGDAINSGMNQFRRSVAAPFEQGGFVNNLGRDVGGALYDKINQKGQAHENKAQADTTPTLANQSTKQDTDGAISSYDGSLKQQRDIFSGAGTVNAYSPESKQQRLGYYQDNQINNGDGTTSIKMLGGTVSGNNRGMQNMLSGRAKNNRYSLEYLNAIAKQGGSFNDKYDGTPLVENGRVLDNPYGYQDNAQSPQENSLNYVRSGSKTAFGSGDNSINMLNTNNQVNNIRDNTQKYIYDAVSSGKISAKQGSNLLSRAKLGSDYISTEQRQAALNKRKSEADINLVNAQASKALNRRVGKPAFKIDTLNELLPADTSPEIKQRLSTIDAGFWNDINKDVANARNQNEVDNIIMQLMQESGIGDPSVFNALIFQQGGY